MMFHNIDFLPGCSPYAQTESEANVFLQRLSDILRFLKGIPAQFINLGEVYNYFQNNS